MTDDPDLVEKERRRGRGARSNRVGRFETEERETFDDGWESLAELAPFQTEVRLEMAKSIIATNDSPDISFEQSINPYRGCEHGCIYCFARPTHCYLGHSAGLDFETKLYAKVNAAELLDHCQPRLPYFAVPRYVEFVDELPATENGKIQKFKLRERGVTPATWDREAHGYKVAR